VKIDPKEYQQLLRDRARLQSLQRRGTRQPAPSNAQDPNYDPNDQVVQAQNEARELKQQIFHRDVRDNVRDILNKPEYASIPESTKKIILRAPHTLSEAKDVDSVVADIEDMLAEEAAALKATTPPAQQQQQQRQPAQNPTGHETPPKVGAGAPANIPPEQLEDTSGLTGRARSQAVFRNLLKQKRGVQA
jgi:hypothetical protein